jgi:putative PIN family toxin of toxin-antitoxin system
VRLVIDTNVIVSALLHPGRTPDQALRQALAGGAVVLVDVRVEAEYRDVVQRRKFAAVPAERREALLADLLRSAVHVACRGSLDPLVDEGDRPFVEVARAGAADALVTGNVRHFPPSLGIVVVTPAELLARG